MAIDPPYLLIAARIRQRILDGELAPGARVPSTRQIARQCGVALATAVKALDVLRQEGLVEAKPRSGTVVVTLPGSVRRKRGRGMAGPAHQLSREGIVQAATTIADAEGLEGLSMRTVAARLGVTPMALYRHIAGKNELIMLIADAAFGERTYPAEPPPSWRAAFELAARNLWALYRRHPWLAELSPPTRPLPLSGIMIHAEWVLGALERCGLSASTSRNLLVLAWCSIQGLAINIEREVQAEAATGISQVQWETVQAEILKAIAASKAYPTFATVHASLTEHGDLLDLDELFNLGLSVLLDGFAAVIEQRLR